jgi:hypothetical protein
MFGLSIPFILFLLFTKNYTILLFILIAGILGMLGEILLSLWWRQFFWKGFWDYKQAAILRGDTSLLNGPAWSLGGLLVIIIFYVFSYLTNINLINITNSFEILDFVLNISLYAIIGIGVSIISGRLILRKDFRGKTLLRYILFSLGIIVFITLVSLNYGFNWLILFLLWGVICFIIEYLFGKMSVLFISKKLWHYTYMTIDHNHTSLLNILPFAIGGFYFFTIYLIINVILQLL